MRSEQDSIPSSGHGHESIQKSVSSVSFNKSQLQDEYDKLMEMEKRISKDQRQRDFEEEMSGRDDKDHFVIWPQYKKDKRLKILRETNAPPKSSFIALGWDETPGQKRKHYRRFYDDELENIKEIISEKTPFNTYKIYRG